MSRNVHSGAGRPVLLEDTAAIARQAVELLRYCAKWERSSGAARHIRSVSLYPPSQARNGMWLVVGKAWDEGYAMVAFYRQADPLTALVGFFAKAYAQKLEWRRDSYVGEGDRIFRP